MMISLLKKTISRSLFLIQDLYGMDWRVFDKFFYYTRRETGMKSTALWGDILTAVFMYQVSILEYYQYRFYELSYPERSHWVGEAFLKFFQNKVNSSFTNRYNEKDKQFVYKKFHKFFINDMVFKDELQEQKGNLFFLLTRDSKKLVFTSFKSRKKPELLVLKKEELSEEKIIRLLEEEGYDCAEEFVSQHEALLSCYPGGLHKIFIFTQRSESGVPEVLGCSWAIPLGNLEVPLTGGYLLAPVDVVTGIVIGPGVNPDITLKDREFHPLTGEAIIGVKLPFWEDCIRIAVESATMVEASFWTWELIISDSGPGLYAARPTLDSLVWQLPIKKGMKHSLNQKSKTLNVSPSRSGGF
jgi:hypothetical protein